MSDKATAAAVEEIKDRPENTGTPIPAANGDVREPESGTAVYDTPEDSEKRRDNGGEDRERETHSKPRVRVKKRPSLGETLRNKKQNAAGKGKRETQVFEDLNKKISEAKDAAMRDNMQAKTEKFFSAHGQAVAQTGIPAFFRYRDGRGSLDNSSLMIFKGKDDKIRYMMNGREVTGDEAKEVFSQKSAKDPQFLDGLQDQYTKRDLSSLLKEIDTMLKEHNVDLKFRVGDDLISISGGESFTDKAKRLLSNNKKDILRGTYRIAQKEVTSVYSSTKNDMKQAASRVQ